MAHEILSVKLYEMDKEFARLHTRIELSETANLEQIKEEIKVLQKQCEEGKLTLRNQLKHSKAKKVKKISEAYDEIEEIINKTQDGLCNPVSDTWKEEMTEEKMILLAEYSLDFAMQAANNALLLSMEAISAQLEKQKRQET